MNTWVPSVLYALCLPVAFAQGFRPAGFITQECLDCICEASSGCNLDIGCNSVGHGQYYCGPYQISYSYWQDAGSPGSDPNNPLDFELCLNNKHCAEGTIRGYMGKWVRDCDDNSDIDCFDIARIHMGGPNGCNGTWVTKTKFWTKFTACYTQTDSYYYN